MTNSEAEPGRNPTTEPFGPSATGHVRLSYGVAEASLGEACGRIADVATCPVEAADLARQIRKRTGFAVRSHVLELFGL